MTTHNPYAPPQAGYSPHAPGAMHDGYGHQYVPLRWRMILAAISIFGMVFMGIAMHLAQLSLGDRLNASLASGTPDLAAAAIIGLTGLGVLVAAVCAWVFVCVWMYRAAANLRGLGRFGMTFSPGSCVGWFFVPFANLWKPPQAMSEIWRASDPEVDQGAWFASAGTSLVAVWWSTWILSGVVSWGALLSKSVPSAEGTIGIVSNLFSLVAGIALVMLMRGVSSRQEQAASRLNGGR